SGRLVRVAQQAQQRPAVTIAGGSSNGILELADHRRNVVGTVGLGVTAVEQPVELVQRQVERLGEAAAVPRPRCGLTTLPAGHRRHGDRSGSVAEARGKLLLAQAELAASCAETLACHVASSPTGAFRQRSDTNACEMLSLLGPAALEPIHVLSFTNPRERPHGV